MQLQPAVPVARKRRDVALIVFVSVVAFVLIGTGVVVSALGSGSRSPANRSAAAAKGFLDALAAADAAKALSFAATPPSDPSLLTNEVLTANQQQAPIADVSATPTAGSDSSVDVAYTLGGQPVTEHWTTSEVDGEYKLDRVTNRLTFVTAGIDRLPLLANGVKVQYTTVELFPGAYAFTTGLPNVDWGADATTTVAVSGTPAVPQLKPRVTTAGKKAFISGAKKIINTCVARHDLEPDDCPFGFRQPSSGPRIPDSTVRWQIKGDPWKKLGDPQIESFTDPGVTKASTDMTFTCRCRFSTGEECRPQDVTHRVTFSGDLASDPMKVEFSSY